MQVPESRKARAFDITELLVKVHYELIQDSLLVEPGADATNGSGLDSGLSSIPGHQDNGNIARFIPSRIEPPSKDREVPCPGQGCIHDCITPRSMSRLSASQRPIKSRRSLGLCQASPPGTCAMAPNRSVSVTASTRATAAST